MFLHINVVIHIFKMKILTTFPFRFCSTQTQVKLIELQLKLIYAIKYYLVFAWDV